ncbi:MAG: hypothetical protein AB7T06_30995 [Kofleriaceae bacterium]
MIPAPLVFPTFDKPEGWTLETKGPRQWLVSPTPGARIVIPPVQGRPRNSSPPMYFDRILDQERTRFARVETTTPITITSRQHYPGLLADLHGFEASGVEREARCYVLFATDALFGVMFLQSHPSFFETLRPPFVALAQTMVLPELETPPPASMEPWDEL